MFPDRNCGLCTVHCGLLLALRGGRVKRPTWQSLYKKARFVFCRDCRVALRAPRKAKPCL
ncbi:MAG: hypothetical protein LBL66_08480 [Clostridiales bacterium]|nr:hypothetical protein [Clostridiales bacterium]